MEKLQKIFLTIGIILLVLIPVWRFLIVPELETLSADFSRRFNFYYALNELQDLEGGWLGEQLANGFVEDKTINVDGNTQVIESWFKAESLEGDLLWETKNKFSINRKTRENIKRNEESVAGSYFLFPQKAEKKSYKVWPMGYNHNFDMQFKGVENIKGLEVYHFGYEDAITDDTDDYGWLELVPDTYNVGSIQGTEYWIEPVTGIIINLDDEGTSFYKDKTTGEKVQDFYIWKIKFKDDTIANQVRIAQNKKQQIILYEIIIPVLLAVIVVALFFAAYIGRKKQ
ncbi:DUF3068 domain-containing protein [Candidatus Woesearchaeota archaeon]|nr:DUF3068 domain-containing protein [Candidatus Woesearchaeota archaeon]